MTIFFLYCNYTGAQGLAARTGTGTGTETGTGTGTGWDRDRERDEDGERGKEEEQEAPGKKARLSTTKQREAHHAERTTTPGTRKTVVVVSPPPRGLVHIGGVPQPISLDHVLQRARTRDSSTPHAENATPLPWLHTWRKPATRQTKPTPGPEARAAKEAQAGRGRDSQPVAQRRLKHTNRNCVKGNQTNP